MSLPLALIALAAGFGLLVKGADLLVDGASSLALRLHIRPIVIGLTVVAFGTSTPELVVNLIAAFKGTHDIAFGNIIGSNIVNILLILGVAAAIRPLKTAHNTIWREIPFSLLAVVILYAMLNDLRFGGQENLLASNDGFILLMFFVLFILYNFAVSKVDAKDFRPPATLSAFRTVIYIIIGLAGLFWGGKLVVEGAVVLAKVFHLSDKVIGLTIIALGTSLPELFTSAVAAYKGKDDIAVGNVVGSNIFNIFLVLGITSMIHPMPFNKAINFDIAVLTVVSVLFFCSSFLGRRGLISRRSGYLFITCYVLYTAFLLSKG